MANEEIEKMKARMVELKSNYDLLISKYKTERKEYLKKIKNLEEIIVNQDKTIQALSVKQGKLL